jgi:uncharacterized membrane protein
MYCPNCGQNAGDYTKICPACGELLDNSSNSTEQTQPANNIYTNYNVSPAPVIPQIPDYKVQSVLLIVFSCVLCCISCISILALPFAIVALVNSNKISAHLAAGNLDLAQEASKKTKMWCWISFGILMGAVVVSIISSIVFFSSNSLQQIIDQYMNMYDFDFDY